MLIPLGFYCLLTSWLSSLHSVLDGREIEVSITPAASFKTLNTHTLGRKERREHQLANKGKPNVRSFFITVAAYEP
jgi:cytidylate kinase